MLLIKKSAPVLLFFLLIVQVAHAQKNVIAGKITDSKGAPISSASVRIKQTTLGTSTDTLGAFTLEAQSSDSLVISAVGFVDTTVIAGGHTALTIALQQRSASLSEAIVTSASPNADAPTRLDAVKQEIITSTFQDWARAAQFSGGQIQGSYIIPSVHGGMKAVMVSANGFGPLNNLNSGALLPVLTHQEDTRGSRYLLKNFAYGLIVDNTGKVIADSVHLMNFDKIDGQLMIARDAKSYLEVDKEKVAAFAFKTPDTSFIFLNVPILSKVNYFILIASGPRYSVYKSVRTKFTKANYVSNGLTESGHNYDEYVDTDTYFWVAGQDSAGVFELKKKSIKTAFANEKSRVDAYFSQHKFDDIDDHFIKGLVDSLNAPDKGR